MGVTGAEIPVTLLFADIRGSTGIGERLSPTGIPRLPRALLPIGSTAILDNGGLVDKLVGDEVIGLFFGGISGPGHAAAGDRGRDRARGPGRARRMRRRWGRSRSAPGSTPGSRMSGRPGRRARSTTSRRSGTPSTRPPVSPSAAAAGELLVSADAAEAAGMEASDAERRTLDVRGREATIDVVVLHPGA